MLPRSATKTTTLTTGAGAETITPTNATVSYDYDVTMDLHVPPCVTNKQYVLNLAINEVQMFALALFQEPGDTGLSGSVYVQFDSGPSPSPFSFDLKEANGVCWVNGDLEDCPLTSTVSTIWVTNENTANMVVQIRAGIISTVHQ